MIVVVWYKAQIDPTKGSLCASFVDVVSSGGIGCVYSTLCNDTIAFLTVQFGAMISTLTLPPVDLSL